MTGTYDSAWKDKLLSWDGTAMTYDAIGNMLTRGGTTYTWTQGRRLSGVENGKSIKYLYDHTGARVKKTVDNTVTEYQWAGDLLLSEKTDGRIIWYCYDSQANLISVTIRGITYFYVRNVQGDIIALVDADGKVVVKYTSDSWGKVIAVTGELADTVVQLAYVHLHALLLQLRHAQHMVKMAVGEQYGVTPKAVFLKVCIYLSRVRRIDYNALVAVIKPHKVSVYAVRAGFYAADCYISVHAVFLA